jgi:hypothetical protein
LQRCVFSAAALFAACIVTIVLLQALSELVEEARGQESNRASVSRTTSVNQALDQSLTSSNRRALDGELNVEALMEQTLQRLAQDYSKTQRIASVGESLAKYENETPNAVPQGNEMNGMTTGGLDIHKRWRERLIAFNSSVKKEDKAYEDALNSYISLDLPSLRWPIQASDEDKEMRTARKDLNMWANEKLSTLHVDASLEQIMQLMIAQTIKNRLGSRAPRTEASNNGGPTQTPKPLASLTRAEWFHSLPIATPQELQDSYRFALIVFLLASNENLGWSGVKRALSHSLVSDDDSGSTKPSGHRVSISIGSSGIWSPMSYENRSVDLQQAVPGLVDKVVSKTLVHYQRLQQTQGQAQDPHVKSAVEELTLMSKVELVEKVLSTLPMTYLQMVGLKIHYHAARELPFITSLPSSPAGNATILTLYTRPFTAALHKAMETICENPEGVDPVPFASKAADDLGNKRWRGIGSMAGAPAQPSGGGGAGGEGEGEGGGKAMGSKNGLKSILTIIRAICK